MINIQLLEATDTIQDTDWCRPLVLMSMGGGGSDYYSFSNTYSGKPENNSKWVLVRDFLGSGWFGKTIGDFNSGVPYLPYEFIRGDIPKSHQLDMVAFNKQYRR